MAGKEKVEVAPKVKEQMRSMHAEGKKAKEILAFVADRYSLELPAWKYYAIVAGVRKLKTAAIAGVAAGRGPEPESADALSVEIKTLVGDMEAAYIEKLRQIRVQLIGAISRIKAQEGK